MFYETGQLYSVKLELCFGDQNNTFASSCQPTPEKKGRKKERKKKEKNYNPETKQIRACGLARKRIFFNRNDDPSQKADGKLAAKIQIAKQSYN